MGYLTKSYCVFKYSSYMGYTELPRNHIGIIRVKQKKGREITVPLPNFPHASISTYTASFLYKARGTARAHIDTKHCHTSPSFTTRWTHTDPTMGAVRVGEGGGVGGGEGVRGFLGHHVQWTQKSGFGTYTRNNCSSVWWILKTCEENCSSERKRKWRRADNDILYIHWTLLLPGKYLSMK